MPNPRLQRVLQLLRHHPLSVALLEAAPGIDTHLVGGVLRDRLLGVGSRDFDALVERDGERVAVRLARTLPARLVHLGARKAFAAYRLVGSDFVFDLWDRQGVPLEQDLARRDFTVDSFAFDLGRERLVDPFGGLADLERRVLRATTATSFASDPLRVLRLPRLLTQLPGFAADPATVELARESAPGLGTLPAERVREELRLLLASDSCHRAVALLGLLDAYPGLLIGGPGRPGSSARAVSQLERLPEQRLALRRALGETVTAEQIVAARWAILFGNLPPGWAAEPTARGFAAAGYLGRRELAAVSLLCRWQQTPDDPLEQRRMLHECGELWPAALLHQGARVASPAAAAVWEGRLEEIAELVYHHGAEIFSPEPLLDGDEVQRLLGLEPGPKVGQAVAALRRAQVEGRVTTPEQARDLLTDLPLD